ncbi:TrkA domain protein [hydrothermal vent metagenome]|uniref:TrkA domain protein n=1 Tax=hydrothermal vent metagenome TaxID=652676 RepID=A0A1W1C023_9ZZZZ
MKKILILSSGSVGEHFIQRVIDTYTSENIYYVVEMKSREYQGVNPARFKFFEFDPTSFYKLANILKMEFLQVFIAMDDRVDVEISIKNILAIKKHLSIIVMDEWGLDYKESGNVVFINANDILASKLIDFLPNVPVIAQNVGLGEGEIMEVSVPFGSSFVYKHLGVIQQKDWKIAAIYRNQKLLLPTRRRMIQPNDILLLIGEPHVLKTVYRAIKQELGQFPEPFGTTLYLLIDMQKNDRDTIKRVLDESCYIQRKLAKELYIRVINPNDIEALEMIKERVDDKTMLFVKYDDIPLEEMILADKKQFHSGVVIVANATFYDYKMRKILYKLHIPVLKLAQKPLANLKYSVLIVSDSKEPEKISNTIFDFSEQFDLNIELYNYLKEHQEQKEQVIEHYYNLSTIFSKKIKVFKVEENPLRVLQKRENFLHVVPFSKKLLHRVIYSYLSTDSDLMYHYLSNSHQMFIPVDDI